MSGMGLTGTHEALCSASWKQAAMLRTLDKIVAVSVLHSYRSLLAVYYVMHARGEFQRGRG